MDQSRISDETHESRPATIESVASRAGVSISSVSRILNGHSARTDTIERVTRAAEELGYVPNAAARSLKLQRTHQIGFAVENVGNPVYVEMLRGAEEVLRPAGYRIVLHSTNADVAAEIGVISDLAKRYVDGLIISPIRIGADHIAAMESAPAPIAIIGRLPAEVELDAVEVQSLGGIVEAVKHLHGQGCRRIAFVNGPHDTVPGRARRSGYEDGLQRMGLELDPELTEEASDFKDDAGERAVERLLARTIPDGMICANDLLAVGAMRALGRRNLNIPDDVAVVGVDDTFLAGLVGPGLTSVSLQSEARGRAAAGLLLSRLENPDLEARRIVINPGLTVRPSSLAGRART